MKKARGVHSCPEVEAGGTPGQATTSQERPDPPGPGTVSVGPRGTLNSPHLILKI